MKQLIIGLLSLCVVLAICPDAEARKKPKTFLYSDDYKDGDEVVGAHLNDSEYRLMVEDIEFRDVEFDWGWYKANYKKPSKPTDLRFKIQECARLTIPPVKNHSKSLASGIEEEVRSVFAEAMRRLGLEVVQHGEIDCELSIAIVDYKASGTYFFFGTADPFIELEIRLTSLSTQEPLVLVRDQEHSSTPGLAAADVASELMQVLR